MKKILLFTFLLSIFNFTKFLSSNEEKLKNLETCETCEKINNDKFKEFKKRLEEKINSLKKNEILNIEFMFKEKISGEKTKITFTKFLDFEKARKDLFVLPNNESEKFYFYNNSEENILKYIDIIINSSIFNKLEDKDKEEDYEDYKEGLKVVLKEFLEKHGNKLKARNLNCFSKLLENNEENFYFCLNFRNF